MRWTPHVTVACVIEQQGKFLLVEELADAQPVLNQPAGHLEPHETLIEAAVREVLEETAWQVEVTGLLGFYTYRSPHNDTSYHRWCFIAEPIRHLPQRALDTGILQALWLDAEELRQQQARLRSPMVLQAVDDYRAGIRYPLTLLRELPPGS